MSKDSALVHLIKLSEAMAKLKKNKQLPRHMPEFVSRIETELNYIIKELTNDEA